MSIDRNGGLSEGRVEYHVGGLPADAGKCFKRRALTWYQIQGILEVEHRALLRKKCTLRVLESRAGAGATGNQRTNAV